MAPEAAPGCLRLSEGPPRLLLVWHRGSQRQALPAGPEREHGDSVWDQIREYYHGDLGEEPESESRLGDAATRLLTQGVERLRLFVARARVKDRGSQK